jgi:serine/threonine protein kinase
MGVVLKAEHKRLKRLVALKVMSASIVKRPDALKRFHREVEAAAKLRHPNVVATDDADEAKGTHFLVMEYVEGTDLSALVKKQGTLSVQQAVQCIIQAAQGLEFAHAQGVVHRDIKPANLLLDNKGTVKILDMGLARIEGDSGSQAELTSTGAVMGTVDYMAPEQALSTKHADARSDIYSLGVSLWYLLVGRCVYDGDTLMSKLLSHRDSPIPSLREFNNEVPESIDLVFRKMVAKKPADRYQTMTEVIRDLEACQTGSAPHVAMPSMPEDLNLNSFLSNLGGSSSSTSMAATKRNQTAVTGVRATPAAEATLLNGGIGVDTDPQTAMSLKNELNPTKKKKSRATKKSPPWFRNVKILVGGGAAALIVLLSVIVLVQTPNGTLRVEILDPNVQMTVKGTDLKFEVSDKEPVTLAAGDKKLMVTRGDLSFETDVFTLRRGEETLIKVELIDGDLIVNSDGQVVGQKTVEQPKPMTEISTFSNPDSPDRRAAEWLMTLRGGANLFIETPQREVLELCTHPMPSGPFRIYTVELVGPIIDRFGDRLAEEVTKRIGGIRASSVWVGSTTLTSEGFAKLMAMPEFSEVFNFNLRVFDANMDDSIFPHLARLKHLKQVSIASGSEVLDVLQSNFTGVGLGALTACPDLTSFEWKFQPISPAALEELSQLPKLESLRFNSSVFKERHAMAIGKLKLLDLQIHSSRVDDNMLRHLAGMEQLQTLDITHNPITDQGLAELRKVTTLKSLLLQGTKVTAEGVADFQAALPRCDVQWDYPDPDRKFVEWLRSLNPTIPIHLIRSDGSTLMVAPDQPLPRESIRAANIQLEGPAFDQAGDDLAEEFATRVKGQRIAFLHMRSNSLTAAGVDRFIRIPELSGVNNIQVCGDQIDDSVFEVVARLPMLKFATFESPRLTGKGLHLLRQLEGLTLDMTGQHNLAVTNIDELQQLPNLQYLNLYNFRCNQMHVESISKLTPSVLILIDVGIDDELAKQFVRISTVHSLHLQNNPLTDRGLLELQQLKKLTLLDVRGTKVTAAGVADFQKARPECRIDWDGGESK